MDIEIKVKNIEPGQVSTVLREVKTELFAPIAPSPVEQLLQAYLQSQAGLQAAQPTPMRSAVSEVARSEVARSSESPRQFQPAQAFGEVGMRRIGPTAPLVTPTVLTTEAQSEDNHQPAPPTVIAPTKPDPFNNNWVFGLVIAAIVLGGWCFSARQNPLSLVKFSAPNPAPSVQAKPAQPKAQ